MKLKENIEMYHLIDALNTFEENYLFVEKDMYASGEWLYADVDINNNTVKNILNYLIEDIEEYRLENNKKFTHDKNKSIIGLSLLVEYMENKFKSSVMYVDDEDNDRCYFECLD